MAFFHTIINRCRAVSNRNFLLFVLINVVFLVFLEHWVVRLLLFFVCAIILYNVGSIPVFDLDPVPISAGLLLVLYGWPEAAQFVLWTLPITDVIAARFNQWSFVNFISLQSALFIGMVFFAQLPWFWALSLHMFIHNLIRVLISIFVMKAGITVVTPVSTNFFIYFILIQVVAVFI